VEFRGIQKHEKYYKLLLKERDKEKRPRIKTCISQLQDMEEIIKTGYQGPPRVRRLKYKDRQKFLPINTYDDFYDIHPKVQKVMIKAMKSLANIRDNYDNIELPNVNLTDDDLVEMAVEFASWVPDKNYKRELEKYITSKKHLLQFAKPISKEEMGMTYFFYDPKYRPYFRINRLNTIEDFATINHEFAHGVFFSQDNPMNEYYNHYYLQELEGSFFDFLSYEYLKGKEESSIITELEYGRTAGRINDLRDFYLTDSAIQLYDKKKKY